MKKTLALLLAAMMLLAAVPAMAEDVPTVSLLWSGDNQWVDGCLVEKEIEKRVGIDLQVIYVTGAGKAEKLNTLIAADQLPDLFQISGQDALDLRDAGKLADISEALEKYGQNILAELGDDYLKMPINDTDDGKVYGIKSNTKGKIDNMVIRKDWLKAVGKEVPTSMEELYEVLKAFTFEDPDGNGVDDTYGCVMALTSNNYWQHFFGAYGIAYNQNYLMEDGTVTTYMKAPEYLTVMKYLRRLLKEGIMDPDFATLTSMQTFEKLWNGKTGFFTWEAVGPTNNWYPGRYTFEVPENPEDLFAGVHFEGVTGAYKIYSGYTSPWVVSAKADVEACIKLLNQIFFTDEGGDLLYMGVEGVMYEWVDKANGKIRRLGEYADDAAHRAAGAYCLGYGMKEKNAELRLYNGFTQQLQYEETAIATDYPFIIQILDTRTEYGADLDNIVKEAFANLLACEDAELESLYADYVQQWEDEGGLEFEEEATAAYKEENGIK